MIWIGTSGYDYPEWRGSFYPERFPEAKMLPFYAEHFSTVEINASFYRMPTQQVLEGWAELTPSSFKLTLKAPRRITHQAGLVGRAQVARAFCDAAARTLGEKLGVLLFQLPPSLPKNVDVLDRFLDRIPSSTRAAFEFRDDSWLSDDVYERLRARNVALCITDSETISTPLLETADFGYLRLRDEGYVASDLDRWAEIIDARRQVWRETFVYFKHEEQGKGPLFARQLMDLLGIPSPGLPPR